MDRQENPIFPMYMEEDNEGTWQLFPLRFQRINRRGEKRGIIRLLNNLISDLVLEEKQNNWFMERSPPMKDKPQVPVL